MSTIALGWDIHRKFITAGRHDILQFSARVLAIFSCRGAKFKEFSLEFAP